MRPTLPLGAALAALSLAVVPTPPASAAGLVPPGTTERWRQQAPVAAAGLVPPGTTERWRQQAPVAGRPEAVRYVPPVAAPVSDPFRAPATPYGPGNRGLEHATEAGTTVHAAAGGVVTFAGPVAGARYVTIQHADRARTTYGPLDEVAVAAGDRIAQGEPVGTTAGRLLWTVRLGDAYLDPAILLAASGHRSVRLVPIPAGAGAG